MNKIDIIRNVSQNYDIDLDDCEILDLNLNLNLDLDLKENEFLITIKNKKRTYNFFDEIAFLYYSNSVLYYCYFEVLDKSILIEDLKTDSFVFEKYTNGVNKKIINTHEPVTYYDLSYITDKFIESFIFKNKFIFLFKNNIKDVINYK